MSGSGQRIYRFGDYELDAAQFELRQAGAHVHVEPQVLTLMLLLAENHGRMVSKDEIIDQVWDGRIVSESAVAARIKAARKAIGDNGKDQLLIRTIHGKGFRFVGEVSVSGAAPAQVIEAAPEAPAPAPPALDGRPSIAVLPFQLAGPSGPHDIIADALPADVLMDLSRFGWLFVIARGSSFRFRAPDTDPVAVGKQLGVRYCLTGTVETFADSVAVTASLVDTTRGGTIWAEQYRSGLRELQDMRPEIEAQVVNALEVQIPRNEVRLARGRPMADLDAWSAMHLGLDHMYRFNKADNARASDLFAHSLQLDPWSSRAMGGLSFTHFQNAFLKYAGDPAAEMEQARQFAHRAVEADRLDPFAHFNVGRSLWLDGRLGDSVDWFDRATGLAPSFAQGLYNRGLVNTMAGKAEEADRDLAMALDLSPLDPLAYAMVSSRSLTHLQMGDIERAAELGTKAAMMPGAHKHIELIAGVTAQLAGRPEEAAMWLAKVKAADPDFKVETFFQSFPFARTAGREVIERCMKDLGL
ncbi:winged helix-turn-helix domain-containing tetratricopeptide repeat protein [Aurantiacibacter gilvus]|uniref:Winged helix-turn-helix domain-containing protein n=1 Tax=Aurantiacibacter gilvus TaxID=3139141 RepID=A0ABU9IEG4_9SPHN